MTYNRRRFPRKPQRPDNYKPPFPDEVLTEPVTNLSLREETSALLLGARVATVGDVLKRTENDFYKICRFNKKNLLDVKFALKKRNLFLKPLPAADATENPNAPKTASEQNNGNRFQRQSNGREQNGGRPPRRQQKQRELPDTNVYVTVPEKPPRPVRVPVKEESDKYVKINRGGLWGFSDRDTKEMTVPAVYDEVFNFKNDICCVQKGEKFGFINRQGEEIIPIEYDCANSFSEGYACVFKNEKCGYINANNETVIDFDFDAGTPVTGGECRVKRNGKWGELHLDNVKEIRWIN